MTVQLLLTTLQIIALEVQQSHSEVTNQQKTSQKISKILGYKKNSVQYNPTY